VNEPLIGIPRERHGPAVEEQLDRRRPDRLREAARVDRVGDVDAGSAEVVRQDMLCPAGAGEPGDDFWVGHRLPSLVVQPVSACEADFLAGRGGIYN
jgi:hypothetical protein